jgi:hypothetical protein
MAAKYFLGFASGFKRDFLISAFLIEPLLTAKAVSILKVVSKAWQTRATWQAGGVAVPTIYFKLIAYYESLLLEEQKHLQRVECGDRCPRGQLVFLIQLPYQSLARVGANCSRILLSALHLHQFQK